MQCGIADSHTTDENRFQTRNRRDGAGAPHLKLHGEQPGHFFLRREFARDGPARCARHEAEPLLQAEVIHLIDDAINVVGQFGAPRRKRHIVGFTGCNPGHHFRFGVDAQAPAVQTLQHLGVTAGQLAALIQANTVATHLQGTAGRDTGIQLTQAARRCVARIDEGLLAALARFPVQLLEPGAGQVDFASHLEQFWKTTAAQAQRHRGDSAHIVSNVLTGAAVTPGGATL